MKCYATTNFDVLLLYTMRNQTFDPFFFVLCVVSLYFDCINDPIHNVANQYIEIKMTVTKRLQCATLCAHKSHSLHLNAVFYMRLQLKAKPHVASKVQT